LPAQLVDVYPPHACRGGTSPKLCTLAPKQVTNRSALWSVSFRRGQPNRHALASNFSIEVGAHTDPPQDAAAANICEGSARWHYTLYLINRNCARWLGEYAAGACTRLDKFSVKSAQRICTRRSDVRLDKQRCRLLPANARQSWPEADAGISVGQTKKIGRQFWSDETAR
jgi:hypothetical protein